VKSSEDPLWLDALKGLERGDFSRLAPLFDQLSSPGGDKCRIIEWYEADHLPIIEALIAAGAKIDAIDPADFPTGNKRIDEALRRHGARSQNS
jgi:hypothetical protein